MNMNSVAKSDNYLTWRSYNDTKNGQLEVSTLNYTSMYYRYIVWGVVTITILGFVLNLILNPEENTMSTILIVGLLLVVYFLSYLIGKYNELSIPTPKLNLNINLPDLPDMPDFSMPDFSMPRFHMPQIDMPRSNMKQKKIETCNRSKWYMNNM